MSEVKHSSTSSTPLQNVKKPAHLPALNLFLLLFHRRSFPFRLHFSSPEVFHKSIQAIPLNHPRHAQLSHQRPPKNLRPNLSVTSSQATNKHGQYPRLKKESAPSTLGLSEWRDNCNPGLTRFTVLSVSELCCYNLGEVGWLVG